jgi:hypothetical protein
MSYALLYATAYDDMLRICLTGCTAKACIAYLTNPLVSV